MFARPVELEKWVGTLAVLCLAAIALISAPPSFSSASRPVRGITNPVLAMEVVRDVSEVDAVISDSPSPDREVMRLKQYADFAFIAFYAALFVGVAMLLGRDGSKAIAWSAGIVGVIAAVFDVAENLGILRILDVNLSHTTPAMIDAIRYPSLLKWALASVAMGLLSMLLLRRKNTGLRIVGALDLAAALLGLAGTADNVLLAWSGLPMLGGFLTLAILYFRPFYVYRRRA